MLVLSKPARADDAAGPPEIESILALPEDKIDIGFAALTFAHDQYPNIDIQAYSKEIDRLAAEVKIPASMNGPNALRQALTKQHRQCQKIRWPASFVTRAASFR
jgi:hypothetical protein